MIAGLVLLSIAMTGVVLLITDLLYDGILVSVATAAVGLLLVGLWFVRPLLRD